MGGELAPGQRTRIRGIVKNITVLALVLVPSLVLFWPFLDRWYRGAADGTPLPPTIPDPPMENLLLDSFIVRDASLSPNKAHYTRIETELLSRLSTKEGDRISYSVFGTDTFPALLPAPSTNDAGIAEQRRVTEAVSFKTTDFTNLFNKLSDAIRRDREAQKKTQRAPHADAILIISDGVPDLSVGVRHCPEPDETFIDPEIVDAFDALIHQKYATQEAIYVRLLIAGTNAGCDSSIEQAWETALVQVSDPVTFRALSYSELAPNEDDSWGILEQELLSSLRRQPRVILSLMPFQERERVKLDSGDVFSIQYAARSFHTGGILRVQFGSIEERKGETKNDEREVVVVETAKLHTIHDPNISSTQPGSQPEIVVPPPSPGKLWGPVKKGSIYMKLENPSNEIVDSSIYQLRLSISSEGAFEIQPTEPLSLAPCSYANAKSAVLRRLSDLRVLTIIIWIIFACGVLLWSLVSPGHQNRWVKQFYGAAEATFIKNWKPWIVMLIAVLFPMSVAGMICAPRPVVLYVTLFLAAALNIFSFYMEGSKSYPVYGPTNGPGEKVDRAKASMMLNLSFHCAQGIVLPLVIEGTAKQIF